MFDPGLVEAVAEGYPDAIQDLIYKLMQQGDPRGPDLIYVVHNNRGMINPHGGWWVAYLSRFACPRCGTSCPPSPDEDGVIECDDLLLIADEQGIYKPASGVEGISRRMVCGWVGTRADLLPPLLKKWKIPPLDLAFCASCYNNIRGEEKSRLVVGNQNAI